MNARMLLVFLAIAFIPILLVHHRFIHQYDSDQTAVQKWFQWEDVNNHETLVILLAGFVVGFFAAVYL